MTTTSRAVCPNRISMLANSSGYIHGGAKTPEYIAWQEMRLRCRNSNRPGWKWYGGRGITICERWNRFEAFLSDMGLKPSAAHSLDRFPNVNGNYGPDNCRWATAREQANNRRNTRFVIYRGQRMPLSDAVRLSGNIVHIEAAAGRINKMGWTVERALETPRLFISRNSKNHRAEKSRRKAITKRDTAAAA